MPYGKVLILRQDHGADRRGVLPDRGVGRFRQPAVRYMFGIVTQGDKSTRERGRQLGVDDEAHQALRTIG
jgi:hypothetical protein